VGSIPYEAAGFSSLFNPSSRTMAMVSTQPLTEMNTRNLSVVKGGRKVHKDYKRTAVSQSPRKFGSLDVSQPCRSPQHVTMIALTSIRKNFTRG
jgi:hypothetical protein